MAFESDKIKNKITSISTSIFSILIPIFQYVPCTSVWFGIITPHEKLKSLLNKGMIPEKLKEVREKFRNHLYSCRNCVYYYEISHCKFKNKYLSKDSICKSYESYDIIS